MKKFATTLLFLAAAATVSAGGLMTNSNQSAAFLRSIARGTSLEADAVYNNPAGVVFMADGFHLGLTNQIAWQTRQTESTFGPFAQRLNAGGDTQLFKGTVFSPFIPSFQFAYKKNRWAVMANLGVNGGGGRVKYRSGLASFERQFAALPGAVSAFGQSFGISASQYDMNMHVEGTLVTFAFSAGAAYRITDWLSASVQLRLGITSNSYKGYMKDIQINPVAPAFGMDGSMLPAAGFFQTVGGALGQMGMVSEAAMAGGYAVQTADHTLDVKQSGTSISPVLALAFHKGPWDASVKYEFKMPTEVKIESKPVSAQDPVINGVFEHGTKVKAETPALLSVAASRHIGPVKLSAEWHYYFDKDAKNSFTALTERIDNEGNLLVGKAVKGNTQEYLFGLEWQISDRWLVGVGYQKTSYDLDARFYSDMNFVTSSYSLGCGVAYQVSKLVRINLSTMSTFYDKVTSTGRDALLGLSYADVYSRKNSVIGIGLDFKF